MLFWCIVPHYLMQNVIISFKKNQATKNLSNEVGMKKRYPYLLKKKMQKKCNNF